MRLTSNIFQKEKMKYVVLEEKKLMYYEEESCEHLEGSVDFDHMSCIVRIEDISNPRAFILSILGGTTSKELVFQA